jgi:hypothetical protein
MFEDLEHRALLNGIKKGLQDAFLEAGEKQGHPYRGNQYGTSLDRFEMHVGNRSDDFRKNVFTPMTKKVTKEMGKFKGRWNGQGGYDFPTPELREKAVLVMEDLKKEWNGLLLQHPEGRTDLATDIAEQFFQHKEKHKITW